MAFPTPTNTEVAEWMDVDFTSLGDAECTRLKEVARRYIQRVCQRTYLDETDPNIIDDLKELVERIVERLFYQKPSRELLSKGFKSEKVGDYSYTKEDFKLTTNGKTGDPGIDELLEHYMEKPGLGLGAEIVGSGPTRTTAEETWLNYVEDNTI